MKIRSLQALAVFLGCLFMFCGIAQAQRMRMSPEEQAKALKDSLSLTDDQTTKITTILKDAREETTALMSQNKDDRDAMRSSMQATQKKTDTKIKAVLTEEQVKKYDALINARRARMQQMRGQRGQQQQ
jgi:Spy/CpxP family protein refolding chaperone